MSMYCSATGTAKAGASSATATRTGRGLSGGLLAGDRPKVIERDLSETEVVHDEVEDMKPKEVELIADDDIPALHHEREMTMPSNVESVHFDDDLLGAVGDIESDGSDSESSAAPAKGTTIRDKILGVKEDESSVHLDALDGDAVDLYGDLESDESVSSEGQEVAMQEALERQREEEAKRLKMAKKQTVIELLMGTDEELKDDILNTSFQVDGDNPTSDESYSFLVN